MIRGTSNTAVDNGWERVTLTFNVPDAGTDIRVMGGIFGLSGTAWFDCFQLEKGGSANAFNLVNNAGFERAGGSSSMQAWEKYNTSAGDGRVSGGHDGSYGAVLQGTPSTRKYFRQEINTSGSEGDVYCLSAWSSGDAIPGEEYRVSAEIRYSNGSKEWRHFDFVPYINSWQFAGGMFSTDDNNSDTNLTYTSIIVHIFYQNQYNSACFDGVQLIKDDGASYVYDSEGNLISAKSAADKNSFTYDGNNNLKKLINPDGTEYTYNYDSNNNLTSAATSDGQSYAFTYDSKGNPLTSVLSGQNGTDTINTSMSYTSSGRQVSSVTDARGNTVQYEYGTGERLLTKETDPLGTQTNYTYDSDTEQLTKVSSAGAEVEYTYDYARLSTIKHNNFLYGFTYDQFGNTTGVTAGNHTLVENTYLPHDGMLSSSAYGNGAVTGYTYDEDERVSTISYNSTPAFTYRYDSAGNMTEKNDLASGTSYYYSHDLIGRPTIMRTNRGQALQIAYDNKNRTSSFTSVVGADTTTTGFTYGDGTNGKPVSAVTGISIDGQERVTYNYDYLGRLSSKSTGLPGAAVQTSYTYLPGASSGTTTTLVGSVSEESDTYSYTYDALGNITTIRKNGILKQRYTYDALGQLIRVDDAEQYTSFGYTYDNGGNLLTQTLHYYTTGTLGAALSTHTYGYADTSWKDLLTSYDGQTITYDAVGNPLTYLDGMSFIP